MEIIEGYKIHECPPNGQGLVALIILAILEKFNLKKFQKLIILIFL
jgi:gamma-glutamyltranspeptidase/glutathione hydrolase